MSAMPQTSVPLLDLDLLRTVVAIAETGNFSSAAQATFRTPSAVSMQVRKLEEMLGRAVFRRDSRSVSLTPDGEQLLSHARRVLALNRDIVSQFIAPEVSGVVRLGTAIDASERLLPSFLKAFDESHPGVTVDVVVDSTLSMITQIDRKDLDIAIITCAVDNADKLGAETLLREPLVWAGVRGGIAWEQQTLPISVWEEGCSWGKAGTDSLEAQGREYRIAFRSSHIYGQKAAVLADLAVAPIPLSTCGGQITPLGQEHDLPVLPEYEMAMLIVDNPNEAVESAADHLRASFAKFR